MSAGSFLDTNVVLYIRASLVGLVINRVSPRTKYGYYGYYFGPDGSPRHRVWQAVRGALARARAAVM